MQFVFVLDKHERPLMPCHPARARQLLKNGKAVIHHYRPFTIRLMEREDGEVQPIALKLDPGYTTTGLALVADDHCVIWAAELTHRGNVVKARLFARRAIRRGRRSRKLRYRAPRFLNRREKFNHISRWLPPSLHSRIDNITCWIERLCRYAPITSISCEVNKFDTQKMQDPEISGVEYQRGTLCGHEIWAYLLEKWERKCAYCGAEHLPLEIEHIIPKSRSGSNRVSNLTLACHDCNLKKGNQTATEFGHPEVESQTKTSLRAAAALTATRWALWERLCDMDLDLEAGTGGLTAYNRAQQEYPKMHWIDAACVGKSGSAILIPSGMTPLFIRATGRGSRKMCQTDKHGFPIKHRARHRQNNGFRTGDLVKARPQRGRRAGTTYISRCVSNASTDSLTLSIEKNFFVHHRFCILLQRADGYDYAQQPITPRKQG